MPFNTALSGISAASKDLSVTGNNIANASTTGFKSSRAEFGDLYASSVLGSGANATGSGVRLQDVAQNFKEGNITFTENNLDMAISGSGFFVLNQDGEQFYTRAGTFGLDNEGHIVNNAGARLQGYPADAAGNISGLRGDLRIETSNLAPRQTTQVESELNLNASEAVLRQTGKAFETTGDAIANAQVGAQIASVATFVGGTFTAPGSDPFDPAVSFDVELTGTSGNAGPVTVTLGPGLVNDIANEDQLQVVVNEINTQLQAANPSVDVLVSGDEPSPGNFQLTVSAIQGEASTISISGDPVLGLDSPQSNEPGVAEVDNGYVAQSMNIVDADGNTVTYTSAAGASASTTASELNALAGVSATATSRMTMTVADPADISSMTISLNGVSLQADSLAALEEEINRLSRSTLPGISASFDAGALTVTSSVGDDLEVTMSGVDGDYVEIYGDDPADVARLEEGGATDNAADEAIVIGGSIEIVLDEGYDVNELDPVVGGLFGPLSDASFEPVTINAFDPTDAATYNSATSMNIYDSLGNAHVMTQYFVRQPYDPADPTSSPNHWQMHVQIDGRNVGDPDTTLPSPANTQPTMTTYDIYFNQDGSLNSERSDEILISNWAPLDENGEPNGAMGPQNVLAGGSTVIPDPPTSSNFVIDLTGTTQYNDEFGEYNINQDGYTTGRLSALNINEEGLIFARFTNGESQALGQIVLAKFTNEQGLEPLGNTMWSESFDSGQPNIGIPGSSDLGAIQSGALEESNVDLSEQLVNLIIAQRNFQANAKTIETADQTTQTIINLR